MFDNKDNVDRFIFIKEIKIIDVIEIEFINFVVIIKRFLYF